MSCDPPVQAPTPARSPAPPGLYVTLWGPDGVEAEYDAAVDLLASARPPSVMLHTWNPQVVAARVRRDLAGVNIACAFGVDGIAREVAQGKRSVRAGAEQLAELAERAASVGAVAAQFNAEASWKTPPTSVQRGRLNEAIVEGLKLARARAPQLALWHTAYDHPTFHSSYPWEAWLGPSSPIEASFPQVYASAGEGLLAHRGALPAREARALASWATAVRKGWIRADAPPGSPEDVRDVDWHPYYQLHGVRASDTCSSALRHERVALWALRARSDAAGRTAFAALCALHRAGLWRRDGIVEFQRRAGLTPDGIVGPKTLAALGITA